MTEPREFVRGLGEDNATFWTGRDVRLDPSAPPEQRLQQIRYRMRQGVYNEPRSVELLAAWIPYTAEREIRDLLVGQLDDEHRHAAIGRRALHLLADTSERQAAARAACREMNERVFAAYRAHRARADRGG